MKEFYKEIILKNKKIQNYMLQNNTPEEKILEELKFLTNCNGLAIHLEGKTNDKLVNVGEVQNSFPVKSGFYKIFSEKELDPNESFEQISIWPTKEGEKFFKDYRKRGN